MNEKKRTDEDQSAAEESRKAKKPYHKPSFRYEQVFETMALACGKVNRRGHCKFGMRKSS